MELKLTSMPKIMGIVNCTDDSFYADSRGGIDLALKLIDEGADIIDIGGESTRPGALYIEGKEELSRILPVIKAVRKVSNIPISVDTRKKSVIEEAWNEGANILNDVSALEDDEHIASFVAKNHLDVILMHKRGQPSYMQDNTVYDNIVQEVSDYLESRALYAKNMGIQEQNIIIDPGIGFGKNLQGNKMLIVNCSKLCGGKYKVLIGLSRKSFIGEMTGRENPKERLYGTIELLF